MSRAMIEAEGHVLFCSIDMYTERAAERTVCDLQGARGAVVSPVASESVCYGLLTIFFSTKICWER
jgi:hypothetical protein